MHYPWWYVPYLTAPMLIGIVAVVHVLVSHYAVGGGLFLAVETGYAYRTGNKDYLAYLRRHARFFVLLTVVFGAITGVGIWWTIGLASPLATGVLIRTFVFGWATEYVFFILEIVSAFIFYYYWGRLSPRIHTIIVWIYGLSAWISLVLITAITAFMLTGFTLDPGHPLQGRDFWSAMLNRQTLPQIVSRTGGALLLSSLYIYLHAAITLRKGDLHKLIESRSTRPALLGAVMVMAGGAGWYWFLPDSARAVLYSASVLNVLMAVIFAATAVVFVLLYLGPYRNPGWIESPGFAAALLLFGVCAFSTGEFIREAVRKPYVVYNVVLGNQIMADDGGAELSRLRLNGFLDSGVWTRAYVRQKYPQVMWSHEEIESLRHWDAAEKYAAAQAAILQAGEHADSQRMLRLPEKDRVALGAVIFHYHCNDCHAIGLGYSAAGPLVQGWTPDMLRALVRDLNRVHFTMPPWSGTAEEAQLVAEYLQSIAPQKPKGMLPEAKRP
ncbi:MAG: cytochrome ubiquinol oxidase subunit I [Thermoguttaceae bacterium]